jgi:hypothetical protein
MKWILEVSLTVALLAINVSAYAASWSYEDHDYHMVYCGKWKLQAMDSDAPNCQNYSGATSYSCCCTTCNDYLDECLHQKGLPQATCDRVKTKCEQDCNGFLSKQSPGKSMK